MMTIMSTMRSMAMSMTMKVNITKTKTMIIVTSEFRKLLYHIVHHDHYVGMPDLLALTVVTKFIYILTMTI